ncbi:MAG: TetR/AcrR family transcriptional regulator [Trueperaceae bacterium]|nr:TetR/AcrR family transcriptional regulator [Trueperaceae bacterium]
MNPTATSSTNEQILRAAEAVLRAAGHPGASTRAVADAAGVPVSQIHYHFGGKQGLMLAVLRRQNEKLIARQQRMYQEDAPLWKQWLRACDFYDEDLESGYVAVLQQMIAAGWSDPAIGAEVRTMMRAWLGLLRDVAQRAERNFGGFGPLATDDVATLVASAWLGAESLHLLGMVEYGTDTRASLRRVAEVLRRAEEASP